jgi:nucleotidyltransferase substrate binding protein (TIGR01987 family)
MARTEQRIATALQALATLDELAREPETKIVRDASIQRFEYTFEAVWKAAQAVLQERYGVELAAPKPVIRACFENGLLSESDTRQALAMVDHRNLTSHTYNETLADEIFAVIPAYRELMKRWAGSLATIGG